ncbi:LLM class flavin-dependent oxidoreductase [Streptomyces caelestis]|uniref:LLM class flavin-dependent oxidoreductase n=1 Tax=Streptomyces caelestis TaxID=36816 RepID=UPI00366A464E
MRSGHARSPGRPLRDSPASLGLAGEPGFHACRAADETWHQDLWPLSAAAAGRTRAVRPGTGVFPVTPREPTPITQVLATLDELSGGRAEAVPPGGGFGLPAQYGVDRPRPPSRVKEALQGVRTLLDEGVIPHRGAWFPSYDGLFAFARPVRQRVPRSPGRRGGPSPSRRPVNCPTGALTH